MLKDFRNEYRNKLSQSKKQAHDKYILESSNVNKAIWDVIKNNNPITKTKASDHSADDFNKFFCSIADKIIGDLPVSTVDPPSCVITRNVDVHTHNFYFDEISFNDLREIILNLNDSPSKDCFNLNVRIIKSYFFPCLYYE